MIDVTFYQFILADNNQTIYQKHVFLFNNLKSALPNALF